MTVRAPAFAGEWYPGDARAVERELRRLMPVAAAPGTATALVAPHAGWRYSGAVAGAVYGAARVPDRVVLIGPNHTGLGARKAIAAAGAWHIPGQELSIDVEAVSALLARAPGLRSDDLAHAMEHSLELQLPFLAERNRDLSIVPVCLYPQPLDDCLSLGLALADAVRSLPGETLLVASTDMNHFDTKLVNNQKDRDAIDRMVAFDPEGLYDVVSRERISMCGVVPATIVLVAARALGATTARLVRYADSSDVDGRIDRVVGYAGLIVS